MQALQHCVALVQVFQKVCDSHIVCHMDASLHCTAHHRIRDNNRIAISPSPLCSACHRICHCKRPRAHFNERSFCLKLCWWEVLVGNQHQTWVLAGIDAVLQRICARGLIATWPPSTPSGTRTLQGGSAGECTAAFAHVHHLLMVQSHSGVLCLEKV